MSAAVMDESREMESIINQMIKDYRWMSKEVNRLQNLLWGRSLPISNWGVAQYGIEAAMPKGSKGKSIEEIKRAESLEEKRTNRLKRYEAEIYLLETLSDSLKTEVQKVIYDCLLEGMTYREIALHINVSKDGVQKEKREIIRQLKNDEQMETFLLYGEFDKQDR